MTRPQATRLGFALVTLLVTAAQASPAERACARTACRPQKQDCAQGFRDAKDAALVACEQLATRPLRAACRKDARHAAHDGIRSCRASARECATCCRTTGEACLVSACGNGLIEGAEACDGSASGACPGGCRTDCTCEPVVPVCGNATLEQGEQCDGADDDACPNRCRSNCTCEPEPPPTCGNAMLDPGEDCDTKLPDTCEFGCTPECTCNPSICGDGLVTGAEQCDGQADWWCPGLCLDDCSCPPPVCGNDVVELDEDCEPGLEPRDCDNGCLPDCTCAYCGNGVIEAPVEVCEPSDDAVCPGLCSEHSCTCLGPPTDTCEAPREIDTFPFVDHQSTLTATTSPGDPNIACAQYNAGDPRETAGDPHEHSVWYALTAPASGLVTVDTEGSDYDTLLVAYTGTCEAPAALTCNDDEVYSDYQSRIAFPVVQGERYLIEAAAFVGFGAGELRVEADFRPCGDAVLDPGEECDPGAPDTCASGTCSPFCECLGIAADECADAPVVTELPVDVRLAAHATTGAASDPLTCGRQPPQPPPSTWFRFVAPQDGTVEITTAGSDYDTVLALFTGECGAPSFVVCNDDDSGLTSAIKRDLSAGVTYTLVVTPWFKTLPGRLGLTIDYVTE